MTTSEEFEKVFAARKANYTATRNEIVEQQRELSIQLETLAKEYHGGNIELEKIRCEILRNQNPKKAIKQACYRLQHHFGGFLNDYSSKNLDTTQAIVHFDCCGDEAAVFTITIPYGATGNERKEE